MKGLKSKVFRQSLPGRMLALALAAAMVVTTVLMMTMSMTVSASNDASPAVVAAREGVLLVQVWYENGEQKDLLQQGSGFLVGTTSGSTTVITNYHVIDTEDYVSRYGADIENYMHIYVVVKRDVKIPASYVNGSKQTDFAILELSQAIYDRKPLVIYNSDKVQETQRVYALGFPDASDNVNDDSIYTSQDVTITSGIAGKFQDVNNIRFIQHDAKISNGNSGGPLIDSEGRVIGVNTGGSQSIFSGETYFFAIAMNEVTEILDMLGVVVDKDGFDSEPTPTPSSSDTQPIEEPTTVPPSTIGEPSVPTYDPIETPGNDGPSVWLIVGIIAAVIVVILIIVLIIVMSSKSRKTQPAGGTPVMPNNGMQGGMAGGMQGGMNGGMPGGMNGGMQGGMGGGMQGGAPIPPMGGGVPRPPMPPAFDSGAGETGVLGLGAGETGVLGGGGSAQPAATLIRRKNGESATITKPSYSIGKERAKVDFCIPDNNSISRSHANIVYRDGAYYIVDNNSTNFTFVNGNKIQPRQEVRLNSGDKIKLADEDFEFRM